MNLSFCERLLLALYLELFNREYNLNDKREYDVGPGILVRHTEMQNTYYLFQNLGIDPNRYGFSWNYRGPYSAGLQALLYGLDEKADSIENFYKTYNNKRNAYHKNYQHQLDTLLSNYLTEETIKKVATTSYLLEDVVKNDMGSEIIAGMIFLEKSMFPGNDLPFINKALQHRGYYTDSELIQKVWKYLAILGIREIDKKTSNVIEKRLIK